MIHIGVAARVAYMLTGDYMAVFGIGSIEPVNQAGVLVPQENIWKKSAGEYNRCGHLPTAVRAEGEP